MPLYVYIHPSSTGFAYRSSHFSGSVMFLSNSAGELALLDTRGQV